MNRQRSVRIGLPGLREFFAEMREGLGLAETELVICFVTDAEMARMNLAFRKKRGPTDVLSFPAVKQKTRRGGAGLLAAARVVGGGVWRPVGTEDEQAGTKARPLQRRKLQRRRRNATATGYLGDIAIAPATARRYAKKNGRSFAAELRVLMLHGALHLLGYDHESDRGEMNRLEAKLRRRFGLA